MRQCWYCGIRLRRGQNATVDHVVPRSKGGRDDGSNKVWACLECNGKKGNLSLEEFRKLQSFGRDNPVTFFGEHFAPERFNRGFTVYQLVRKPESE